MKMKQERKLHIHKHLFRMNLAVPISDDDSDDSDDSNDHDSSDDDKDDNQVTANTSIST
jgi:hypothetical protein